MSQPNPSPSAAVRALAEQIIDSLQRDAMALDIKTIGDRDNAMEDICGVLSRAFAAQEAETERLRQERDGLKDLLQQALNQYGIPCPLAYAGREEGRHTWPDHRANCPRCRAEDLIGPGWYINPETAKHDAKSVEAETWEQAAKLAEAAKSRDVIEAAHNLDKLAAALRSRAASPETKG